MRSLEFRNSPKAKLNQRKKPQKAALSPNDFNGLWIELPPLLTATLSRGLGYAWVGF